MEAYDMFASHVILFNHESPIRGEHFVTRKLTLGACAIKLGLPSELLLWNLDAKRDWGFAKEYVEAMWLMLQQKKPEDFVISNGKTYSIKDYINKAKKKQNLKHTCTWKRLKKKQINKTNRKTQVKQNKK